MLFICTQEATPISAQAAGTGKGKLLHFPRLAFKRHSTDVRYNTSRKSEDEKLQVCKEAKGKSTRNDSKDSDILNYHGVCSYTAAALV